jgi:hypothetical protein
VFVFDMFRELIDMLGHNDNHPSVLANTLTFDAMQPEARRCHCGSTTSTSSLLVRALLPSRRARDGRRQERLRQRKRPVQAGRLDEGYIEWPDANVPGSVVYISFSSLSVMSTRQM